MKNKVNDVYLSFSQITMMARAIGIKGARYPQKYKHRKRQYFEMMHNSFTPLPREVEEWEELVKLKLAQYNGKKYKLTNKGINLIAKQYRTKIVPRCLNLKTDIFSNYLPNNSRNISFR